jgi:hypothetical protein
MGGRWNKALNGMNSHDVTKETEELPTEHTEHTEKIARIRVGG